ncbi:thioredoxin-like protein [Piptocephalis cylindrospora]|uniref:Thioredoxin-like protein n=1 Tax=Piptocephalis cylindrospora TaxID=1907219 RepID=A0A4P9Y3K3_9FUNG|nr:thioredoxin-like protein [Piptocephalis cylindrospora]|eukprot:RKP13222.1 thioredoxin-like protein [Piptocephalis cylindrospora]
MSLSSLLLLPLLISSILGKEWAGPSLALETFDAVVQKGNWLVKHFSPQCPHCKKMAPVWMQLVDELDGSGPARDWHFAEVNCLDEPDLCDDHDITAYPQIILYHNGDRVEEYEKATKYKRMKTWITKMSYNNGKEVDAVVVPLEDDNGPKPNPDGINVELDGDTFDSLTSVGPWFIKYYAPWCGHCQQLAPTWLEMAQTLQGQVNVGEVDCTVQSELCEKQDIKGFPTVKFYHSGASSEFRSSRSLEALTDFALRASRSPLIPTSPSELHRLLTEHDVIFVYIEEEEKTDGDGAKSGASSPSKKAVELASRPYFEHAHFAHIHEDVGSVKAEYSITHLPALLVLKDGGHKSYSGPLEESERVKDWIEVEKYASLITLTDQNARDILKGSGLMVVLGLLDPEADNFARRRDALKSIALHYRKDHPLHVHSEREGEGEETNRVLFAWLNAVKWENYADRAYGVGPADIPAIILVQPEEEEYWDEDAQGGKIQFVRGPLLAVLEDARAGRIPAKSSLGAIAGWVRKGAKHMVKAGSAAVDHAFWVTVSILGLIGVFVWYARRASRGDGYREVDTKAD